MVTSSFVGHIITLSVQHKQHCKDSIKYSCRVSKYFCSLSHVTSSGIALCVGATFLRALARDSLLSCLQNSCFLFSQHMEKGTKRVDWQSGSVEENMYVLGVISEHAYRAVHHTSQLADSDLHCVFCVTTSSITPS